MAGLDQCGLKQGLVWFLDGLKLSGGAVNSGIVRVFADRNYSDWRLPNEEVQYYTRIGVIVDRNRF